MRSVRWFFAIALGMIWTLHAPAVLCLAGVLPGDPDRFGALIGLGALSPLVAACVASRMEGRGRIRELFAKLRPVARDARWYLVAFATFPLVHVLGEAAYRAIHGSSEGAFFYPPTEPQHVVGMLIIPFVEEIGWRGFAMPRLTERLGALRASAMVGAGWAAWHATMFALQGDTPTVYAASMLMIFLGSFVFGWLFVRSRGSLVVAWLAHVGVHFDNPTRAIEQTATPYLVFVAATAIAGAVAVVSLLREPEPAKAPHA